MTTRAKLAIDGGTPARQESLPPSYPGALFIGEEEKQAALEVIESQSLFRYYGPKHLHKVESFEAAFAKKIGAKDSLGVSSGTASLKVALTAMGVGPGDEVIVPCFTFIASMGAVVHCGAVPVFCEIDESFGIDPQDLEKRITPYTKAVMPVHFGGVPCRMDEIKAICEPRGILVLEDVAQSCGAAYKGRRLGSIGDIGGFSFQLNKIITAGEGGAVTTSNDDLLENAIRYHDQGFWRGKQDEDQIVGENYRMTEMTAAIMLAQLEKLDTIIGNQRARKAQVLAGIQDCTKVRFRDVVDAEGEAGNSVTWICDTEAEALEFVRLLNAENVNCGRPYGGKVVYQAWPQIREKRVINPNASPWTSPFYKGNVSYDPGTCPNSEDLLARSVWTGISPILTEEDGDQIIAGFRKVYDHIHG